MQAKIDNHASTEQIKSVFFSHKDTIIKQLNDIFFSYAFGNIYTLNPRQLSEYGLEEYNHFVNYLSSQDDASVYDWGGKRAHEGLCMESILEMSAFLCKLCFENLDTKKKDLLTQVFNTVHKYTSSYLGGFSAATREKTIHQQKEIRQALSATLTEQRAALFIRNYAISSSINGILLTDVKGNVTYVNPSFLKMCKYRDLDEVIEIGRIIDIAGNEVGDIFASLTDEESWRGELQLKRKDGTKIDVEMSASRITDEKDNMFGKMASFVDITERKRIEAQLRRGQKMNALGQLAAGITHDFNNMFAVVRGYLQLILQDVKETSQLYQDIQQIKTAIERSSGLTKQLQYFARGITGDRNPIDINAIITESRELLARTFPPEVELVLSLKDDLWTLKADVSQISNVIINFCVNARESIMDRIGNDATGSADKGTITIKTRNRFLDEESASQYLGATSGRYIHLSIADNGTGMTPETLERLFEPFYTTKRTQKNTGLGLSIIYGIVENLKGHIDVQSELGRGSVFNVYFPASDAKVVEDTENRRPSSPPQMETVLIVDDELQLLEITSRFLKQNGYKVITAEDGSQAVAIYQEASEEISLVILDIVMPEMSGAICLREIKRINPSAKVLLITGCTNDESSYEAMRDNVMGVIEKPFELSKMAETIENALQS